MLYANEAAPQFDSKGLDLALLALDELAQRKSQEEIAFSAQELKVFCKAIIAKKDKLQIDLIENLVEKGVSLEKIYEIFIPETAEMLGNLWKKDKLSFFEVNIGAQRLHRLSRIYENRYLGPLYLFPEGPDILLILPEGEIHTLGIITASGIFKKKGINPFLAVGYSKKDIIELVKTRRFSLVGVSVSNSKNLTEARQIAKTIKNTVKEPLPVILGGQCVKTLADNKTDLNTFDVITSNPDEVLSLIKLESKAI